MERDLTGIHKQHKWNIEEFGRWNPIPQCVCSYARPWEGTGKENPFWVLGEGRGRIPLGAGAAPGGGTLPCPALLLCCPWHSPAPGDRLSWGTWCSQDGRNIPAPLPSLPKGASLISTAPGQVFAAQSSPFQTAVTCPSQADTALPLLLFTALTSQTVHTLAINPCIKP